MPLHTSHTQSAASAVMTLLNMFILWFLNHGDLYYSCWRDFHLPTATFSRGREWSDCACACCLLLHAPRSAGHSSSHHAEMTWAPIPPNLKANAFLITRLCFGFQAHRAAPPAFGFKVMHQAHEEQFGAAVGGYTEFNLQSGLFLLLSSRERERKKCLPLAEIW